MYCQAVTLNAMHIILVIVIAVIISPVWVQGL